MKRVDAQYMDLLHIEFCVNGEKKADIMLNPSMPGGCRKIYDAIVHDTDVLAQSSKALKEGDSMEAVVQYMQGKFDVAGELIDGIAEAIGPGQYAEIADYLPVIGYNDLASLASVILDAYADYQSKMLTAGFKHE